MAPLRVFHRWIAFAVIFCVYALRFFLTQSFYIITYGLGIFVMNFLIGFLSPQVDPEMEGPRLLIRGLDEFRPFVRRLPEFKFWYGITMAFCIAFVLTFFDVLDVPVFWPILLVYWLVLFVSTMKRQLMHMVRYKYVPFSVGKQKYFKKRSAADEEADSS
uniref:Protein RER1 n=1 Tax=Kalanchoe fedtschenkoi TaxID=63787 RepID=A0A7N0TPV8_KALFE